MACAPFGVTFLSFKYRFRFFGFRWITVQPYDPAALYNKRQTRQNRHTQYTQYSRSFRFCIVSNKGKAGQFFGKSAKKTQGLFLPNISGKIQVKIIFEAAPGNGAAFDFGQVQSGLGKPGKDPV